MALKLFPGLIFLGGISTRAFGAASPNFRKALHVKNIYF
jgi:hypothetical protein